MNIVNEQVSHSLYKEGKVIAHEESILIVQFSEEYGIKKFIYPDAFEKYLKLTNSEVEVSMLEELHDKHETKVLKEQQKYEEILQIIEDRKPKPKLATRKKKLSSKSKTSNLADKKIENNDV